MTKYCFLILFQLILIRSYAQNVISIKSPLPDSVVRNGEIWIVCVVDPRLKILPGSVQMFIEGAEVSPLIKVNGNTISILVMNKLRPDKYNVELRLRSESGKLYRKRWAFYVGNFQSSEDSIIEVRPIRQKQEIKPQFKGTVFSGMRFTSLHGNGAYLRQEPPQMHDFRMNATLQLSNISIPLKIYLTNQENKFLPFRNRFMSGIQTDKTGLLAGDINLNFNRIALNGTSARGLLFEFKIRSTAYSFFHGYVNRAIEGEKLKFDGIGFPPGNMLADSFYLNEGTYRRKLSAMNVIFTAVDGTRFNIMFLKSMDDSNSIRYGGQVSQNFVFGAGNQVKTKNNRFTADMQVALSLTTFDIRRGVYSKQMIDNIFGSDIPFYPENWKWLMIFNGTTTPMTWKNRPPLAFFGDYRLNALKQSFLVSYHRTGSAFYSFGNPFLVNDRRYMSFEDRFTTFNKKLRTRIQYTYTTNNLSKTFYSKKNTNTGMISFNFRPSKKLPSFDLSYRYFNRVEKSIQEGKQISLTELHNLVSGFSWNLKTGSFQHILQVNYNYYLRKTPGSPTASRSLNFYLNEQYRKNLMFSAYFNSFVMTNDSADLGIINMLGIKINLISRNEKLKTGGGISRVVNEESGLMEASDRMTYEAEISYSPVKNLIFTLNGGYGSYQEDKIPVENYQEKWIYIRLNYLID